MRTHLKASKFVVVKAGTSTVSHDDGTPSLPRLGAIVEAVSQLMRQGTKVILVSSGAVGSGPKRRGSVGRPIAGGRREGLAPRAEIPLAQLPLQRRLAHGPGRDYPR